MLGRVTFLAYDTNGNWFADAKVLYKWSDPWVPDKESEDDYEIAMEDRNGDGRWDTWWEPTGESEDGDAVVLLRGDTDLDGLLDPGEEWLYTAMELASVEGLHHNDSKATGTPVPDGDDVSDTDPANYTAVLPSVLPCEEEPDEGDGEGTHDNDGCSS